MMLQHGVGPSYIGKTAEFQAHGVALSFRIDLRESLDLGMLEMLCGTRDSMPLHVCACAFERSCVYVYLCMSMHSHLCVRGYMCVRGCG